MKLIKDGRLFGKINLIDFAVILLVVAVVVSMAVSMIVKHVNVLEIKAIPDSTQEEIEYKVICRMVSKVMLPDFESAVKREEQIMSGGKLVEDCFLSGELEVSPFYESYVDENGLLQRAESEDFCTLVFTISGTAPYWNNSYHVGSQEVRTGKSHILKTNSIEITGNVISMVGVDSQVNGKERAEENRKAAEEMEDAENRPGDDKRRDDDKRRNNENRRSNDESRTKSGSEKIHD